MSHRLACSLALAGCTTLLLAACSAAPPTQEATADPLASPAPAEQAAPAAPDFDPARFEVLMSRPLDGSSLESFEAGLADLRSGVPPEALKRLQSSLEWLLFYDIGSRGDRAALYRSLDGLTPREIIQRGRWSNE